MYFVEIGFILLLCSLTRFIFLHGSTSDTWVELWLTRKFVDGEAEFMRPGDSVVEGIYGRPFLMNRFLSCFPDRYWRVVGTSLNIGADLCLITGVYALTLSLQSNPSWIGPLTVPGWTALLTGLTPLYHPISSRLRGCIKTRSAGTLLALLSVGTMWIAIEMHLLWVLPSIGMIALTLLTSQFGIQIVVLFLVIMSFWKGSLLPVGVLSGMSLALWWVSDWFRVFCHWKLGHFRWYYDQQRNVSPTKRRNRLRDLVSLPYRLVRDPVGGYRDLAGTHSVTALVCLFPTGIFVFYTMGMEVFGNGFSEAVWWASDVHSFSLYMTGAASMAFVLTSVYPLLFLGEAERYFEPSAPFVTFLFVNGIQHKLIPVPVLSIVLLWSLVIILLNFICVSSDGFKQTLFPQENEALQEVVRFLEGKRGNVLTIPIKYSCLISSKLQGRREIQFLIRGVQHEGGGKDWHEEIRHNENHSYPQERLREIVDRFRIDYLVVHRNELEDRPFSYSFSAFTTILKRSEFTVYAVND